MWRMPALCVVLVAVISLTTADLDNIPCDGLHPGDGTEVQNGPVPFQIFLDKTGGVGTPLKPNEEVRVVIKPAPGWNQTFTRFAIQGHHVQGSPIGSWLQSPHGHLKTCNSEADTLIQYDATLKKSVAATWRAPSIIAAKVEFQAYVIDQRNRAWTDIHSVLLQPEVPLLPQQPGPVMIEDTSEGAEVGGRKQDSPAREEAAVTESEQTQADYRESEAREEEELEAKWKKEQQEKIDLENGSVRDWIIQVEQEKKTHNEEKLWEEREYEKQKQEVQRRRQENLRREQEGIDRKRAEEREEERRREKSRLEPVRGTHVVAAVESGSARTVCSLAAIWFAVIAMVY